MILKSSIITTCLHKNCGWVRLNIFKRMFVLTYMNTRTYTLPFAIRSKHIHRQLLNYAFYIQK